MKTTVTPFFGDGDRSCLTHARRLDDSRPSNRALAELRELVEGSIAEPILVKGLAEVANCSPYNFMRTSQFAHAGSLLLTAAWQRSTALH